MFRQSKRDDGVAALAVQDVAALVHLVIGNGVILRPGEDDVDGRLDPLARVAVMLRLKRRTLYGALVRQDVDAFVDLPAPDPLHKADGAEEQVVLVVFGLFEDLVPLGRKELDERMR